MTGKRPKARPANIAWGGRFSGGPAEIMQRINVSIEFDKRLYAQDIAGSLAHCAMLVERRILSRQDGAAIARGLEQIRAEIEGDTFPFRVEHEDIHLNIEARLQELVGAPAGRLHTARSRNDQVATDLKLWVRDAIDRLDRQMAALQGALIDQAAEVQGKSEAAVKKSYYRFKADPQKNLVLFSLTFRGVPISQVGCGWQPPSCWPCWRFSLP